MAMRMKPYVIGENGRPIAAGVVCKCGEGGFCPAHGEPAKPDKVADKHQVEKENSDATRR